MSGGRSSNFGSLGFLVPIWRILGFGTNLGVSEGHVRIKGWETQVAWVNKRHGGFLLIF